MSPARLGPLALALVVAALYGAALGFPFVYDDAVLIAGNAALADWSTLPEALSRDLFHFASTRASPYWRPTVTASYYVDHAVGGGAPWAFHATNLVALWVAGWGLMALLRERLGSGAAWAPLLSAALFLAHPLQVEGAANIAGRTDVLCAAFGLWALVARRPAVAGALAWLACGSKEIGVILPVAAWLLGRSTWRAQALAAGIFLIGRQLVLSQVALLPEDQPAPDSASAAGAGARIVWYLGRIVWPDPLAPALALSPHDGAIAIAGWGVLALLAVLAWRRPPARPSLALLVLPLLPVSGLVSANLRYGETFLVLPLAGSTLAASAILARGRVGIGLALAGIVAGALWGRPRVQEWSSERALWSAAHQRTPDDVQIRLNLARTVGEDEPAQALSLLQGASFGEPRRDREIAATRAWALLAMGREDAALPELAAASADDPEAAWATSMACVLSAPRADAQSGALCEIARRLSPDDPDVFNASGMWHGIRGEHAAALPHFERAAALAPERAEIQRNLAIARRMAAE